jgi:hypothetical protein
VQVDEVENARCLRCKMRSTPTAPKFFSAVKCLSRRKQGWAAYVIKYIAPDVRDIHRDIIQSALRIDL